MHLGIDFGTCYSSAALLDDDTGKIWPIKEPLKHGFSYPSSVFWTEQGEFLVGQAAENARQRDYKRYRCEFKRELGDPYPCLLGEQSFLPEELVAELIRKLKIEADKVLLGQSRKKLANAVVTIPATYHSRKRQLTQDACIQAGFSQASILEEPVAAAIYYSQQAAVKDGEIILVYDLGGGTFDATLIEKQTSGYQLLTAPKGLPQCGGIDFDRLIFQDLGQHCSETLRQHLNAADNWLAKAFIRDLCRSLKHQLSEEVETTIYIPLLGTSETYSLSRQAFNGMITPLIAETIEVCDQLVRSVGIEWQKIDQVLLVGGSCRIPYIKESITQKLERQPVLVDEPELAVCMGAALYQPFQPRKSLEEELQDFFRTPSTSSENMQKATPKLLEEEVQSLFT